MILYIIVSLPIAQAETVKVVTEYLSNYQLKMPDGSLGGYAPDVVKELFKRTGDESDIQVLPWARAYQIALSEPNTMIFSMARTELRENKFLWVGAISSQKLYFWGLKSKFTEPLRNWFEFSHFSVSVYNGSGTEQLLTKKEHPLIYRVESTERSLQMMLSGRVDLTPGSREGMTARLTRLNQSMEMLFPVFDVPELNNNLWIAFHKDSDPQLVARYREKYQQLKSDGVMEELQLNWGIH